MFEFNHANGWLVQVMQEEYGLYVWPCSIVLAEYIWQNRQRFAGARVLEVPQLFFLCVSVKISSKCCSC